MESRISKKGQPKELTSRLSKDELMRRLKAVMDQLTNSDQEDDIHMYDQLAASLVMPFLMKHKDKDVRLYTACCLADILRLYAPEPPYNEDQLKSIFELIVNQLRGVENTTSASYQRHFYLLESLALVKTFNICMELDTQEIVIDLFKVFFKAINSKHTIKVRGFMLDVMCPIIQEGESLPQELLDTILMNLTKPGKKKSPEAYKLAADLITKTSSSIEPYVQLFFNNVLILGQETESELADHLYDLVYELNKVSRNVLLSVLPQLEFKLKSTVVEDRMQMVKLLAKMFSDDSSNLAEQNRPLWMSFLGRFVDVCTDVRVECVQNAKLFLTSCPKLVKEVAACLHERFHDTDERVRLETVVCTCEAAAENIDNVPEMLFSDVKERMRDKKWSIRREALTCVAKLYKRLTTGSDIHPASVKKIMWAPNKLLCAYYQNSIDDRLCIERILHGCIIPVTLDNKERMTRLLKLYAEFDEMATVAFHNILKCRTTLNSDLVTLLQLSTLDETPDQDKLLSNRIISLARALPDPYKSQEHLKKFVTSLSDKKLYNNLSIATDITKGCPDVMKAITDIVKSLAQRNWIDTIKALLDRCCPMMIDSQSLLVLYELVKKSLDGLDDDEDVIGTDDLDHVNATARAGLKLIQVLSTMLPEIFKSNEVFEHMLVLIKHSDPFVVETTLHTLCAISDGLEEFDKSISSCFSPVLKSVAINGTKKSAAFAVRALSKLLRDPDPIINRLLTSLIKDLKYSSPNLLSMLASLGEIAKERPSVFAKKHKDIIRDFIVKDLIVQDRESSADSQESEDEWCQFEELPRETKLKIQGIKVLTKWLQGLQSDHKTSCAPVFRMFDTLLRNNGDINGKDFVGPHSRSHLRLAVAKGLINVMQHQQYADSLSLDQYQQLGLIIQDSCYEVRQAFTIKLHKALISLRLPLDFLAYLALSAVDPANERRSQVHQMLTKNAQSRRDFVKQNSSAAAHPYSLLPEYSLPYVIHLLAHHPDFDHKSKESLSETKDYLMFFLDGILNNKTDTYSFVKKMVEKIKQTCDAQDVMFNEKLYTLCDLVIAIIVSKSHSIVLKDFPGNPGLPRKLFELSADKKHNTRKNYLPKDFIISPSKPLKAVTKQENKQPGRLKFSKRREPSKKKQLPASRSVTNDSEGDDDDDGDNDSDSEDDLPLSVQASKSPAKIKTIGLSSASKVDSDDDNESSEDDLPLSLQASKSPTKIKTIGLSSSSKAGSDDNESSEDDLPLSTLSSPEKAPTSILSKRLQLDQAKSTSSAKTKQPSVSSTKNNLPPPSPPMTSDSEDIPGLPSTHLRSSPRKITRVALTSRINDDINSTSISNENNKEEQSKNVSLPAKRKQTEEPETKLNVKRSRTTRRR